MSDLNISKDQRKSIGHTTTFNSPFGGYKIYGYQLESKAPVTFFQQTISQILENIDGCEAIADDILIRGHHWASGAIGGKSDPEVVCPIMARSYTFMEIDHEIYSMVILVLLLIQEWLQAKVCI